MKLEIHIADLLKLHNCVIVPEFGGFIASYESAWINRNRSLIFPPSKKVLFNESLKQNDGLLANELVIQHNVNFNQAMLEIQNCVDVWKKNLEAGQRIELGEIGFLFKQENKIVFEQNRETNLLLQAYGLNQVSFVDFSVAAEKVAEQKVETISASEPIKIQKAKEVVPVLKIVEKKEIKESVSTKKITPVIELNQAEKIEEVESEIQDEKIIPIQQPKKKSRNYKYAIAAAVILPALFYSYWIPMKTDFLNSGKIHLSDLNPFSKKGNAIYEKRTPSNFTDTTSDWMSWEDLTNDLPADVTVYNLELTDEVYIPVDLEKEPLTDVNSFQADGSYHIIGGCFSVESNASNFVKKLTDKGYSAGIADKKNGLFRVSAGSYSSESEAESALDKFESDGFSGWILKN